MDGWILTRQTVKSTGYFAHPKKEDHENDRLNLSFDDQYPSLKACRNSSDSAPALQHHRTYKKGRKEGRMDG